MKKLCVLFVAVLFAAAAFHDSPTHVSAKNDKFKRSSRPVPNSYIVVLNDSDDFRFDPADTIDRLNRDFPGNVGKIYLSALQGYSVQMTEEKARALSNDPRVSYVEEDSRIDEQSTETNATWGISRIDQRNFSSPLDTEYNYDSTGMGVNVYVVDTGILVTHPDFAGRAINAFDSYNENVDITQCNGHGTHVAGTIGSNTFGVAKNVQIFSVKVFPCYGGTSSSSVIAGIDWINRNGIRPAVVNMSLAGTASNTLDQAVKNSINQGFTYVVAAGNYSTDACGYSPADVSDAITVGATHTSDSRDETTNYGRCIDIFAPGVAITSTWNQYPLPYPTFTMSGTSTAAPHVAGVAALYLERHPAALPADVSRAITSGATAGAVFNPGAGSPNLLLFSLFDPVIPGCDGVGFVGILRGAGTVDFQSSISGFNSQGGKYLASLQIPAEASFSLSLEKKGGNRWLTVATSSNGSIAFNGKSGTYRWKIADVAGSGSYSLCTITP